MNIHVARASLLAMLLAAQGLALAETSAPESSNESIPEGHDAASLHQKNCVACHGSEVYTREDRMVDSLAGLETQVRRCDAALELRWFDEDIAAVTSFLNDRFYGFEN